MAESAMASAAIHVPAAIPMNVRVFMTERQPNPAGPATQERHLGGCGRVDIRGPAASGLPMMEIEGFLDRSKVIGGA